MSSSLSEDEFHRMQLQLIDLRTTNYELDGKCKKLERETIALNEKNENIDRQLQNANKAIQKSKKAKEVEVLLQESDNLQRKLLSQEDDFRLQNQTLMQELTALVATNEVLEKELKEVQSARDTVVNSQNTDNTELEDEIRRLQAQNTVLQKNLTACQDKFEKLHDQLNKTESSTTGANETIESGQLEEENGTEPSPRALKVEDEVQVSSEEHGHEINVLKLQLDTLLEEKRMLREKLTTIENENKVKVDHLQEELDKTSEKLKKKQESFIHLQEEKENLFKETNQKLEESQSSRDRDKIYYTDQINKLQQEVQRSKQSLEERNESSDQNVKHLQSKLQTLQQQIDASDIVNSQKVKECSTKYEQQLEELRNQNLKLLLEKGDLVTQLQAIKNANQETLDQLYALQQEREGHIQQWQEVNKVAEKRKSMLDELANKYQRDSASHQEKLRLMEEEQEAEVRNLQTKLNTEHKRVTELEKMKSQFEEIKIQVSSLEEAKGWLERRLKETEDQFNLYKEEREVEMTEILLKHDKEISSLEEKYLTEKESAAVDHSSKIEEYVEKEKTLQTELDDEKEKVEKLKQELKDGVDEKKIHEKKGLKTLKDLKRQLHAERKRGEKLQDKLQEVLTDTKHNKRSYSGVEELLSSVDRNDSLIEDRSSVSSWNTGYSQANTSIVSSPQSPEKSDHFPSTSNDVHVEEHNELLNRLGNLQQAKWNLEEKVSHLETSNSAMAEDLIQKTKIIEHYVRDTGTKNDAKNHPPQDDKLTLKKVLDLVNKNDEQNLKDMNKKLQRMLEETLTKNMCLEQNLEAMSLEVVRLSKVQPADAHNEKLKEDTGACAAVNTSVNHSNSDISDEKNKLSEATNKHVTSKES
ncbi:GRIP1-associated protein 1-like isoform X1 [Mytilus galloprovincialis]|uniref:GRIP1-associated protein 1-like isoform X1 n=1 Tax=Mytilus galloprovincialis TaxID=29158 RepID=UPI003F7B90E2